MSLHNGLRDAELNELYYRELAGYLTLFDKVVRVLAALTSSATVVAWSGGSEGWKFVSVVAAGLGVVGATFNIGDQARKFSTLGLKWSALVGEFRVLELRSEVTEEELAALVVRSEALQAEDDLPPYRGLIRRCQAEIEQRHAVVTSLAPTSP